MWHCYFFMLNLFNLAVMNIQDIKTFIRLEEELDNLCSTIFYYVKDKYVKQLDFNKYSSYNKYYVTLRGVSIEYKDYGYDLVATSCLPTIPFELLEIDSSWQQFLDDYYEKKRKEEEEKKVKEEKAKENKEREVYERLKKKFGNETI